MVVYLKEVRTTSRRLKRLIEEEEKTISRIAELQDYLKSIREQRKQEEDLEIIKSIRSMKLGARDLFDLLNGIQDGSVTMEMCQSILDAENVNDPSGRNEDYMPDSVESGYDVEVESNHMRVGNCRPESEDNEDDRHHD